MNACISNSPAVVLANTINYEKSSSLWIISGHRGSGKTRLCSEIVALKQSAKLSIGGFYSPAVFKDGKKIAIDLHDIASGARKRLGVRHPDRNNVTVGDWNFDKKIIDWGNEILAALKNEWLIVIDEIGPLELLDGGGFVQALQLLDERNYRSAIVVVRPKLLSLACMRWSEARVINLTGDEL